MSGFSFRIAVEIISPNDLWEQVYRKLREHVAVGVREIWLISLEQRAVLIHHAPVTPTAILTEVDELASESSLPGFRCRGGEIFKQPARCSVQD